MKTMTVSYARKLFGSNYRIAQICDINASAVGRWGEYVPEWHIPKLMAVPLEERKLKRGGLRVAAP